MILAVEGKNFKLVCACRRRGHRLKCWECGVKKKAPCGKIDRDDLPWCCHRRLGEWLPRLSASPGGNTARMILKSEPLRFLPKQLFADMPVHVLALYRTFMH